MEFLTGIDDTDLEILNQLRLLDLCNLSETCQSFSKFLYSDKFWQQYIYNQLIKHNIKPSTLEKYRPKEEPYVESYIKYYYTKTIYDAMNENRFDIIIFIQTRERITLSDFCCREACTNNNIIALDFFYNEYGLHPIYLGDYNKSEFRGPRTILTRQPPQGRSRDPPSYVTTPYRCLEHIISHDCVDSLDWVYNKNKKIVSYLTDYFDAFRRGKKSLEWFKMVNERDHLGLSL